MNDSPPPMIVQLREELALLILSPEVLLDPTKMQVELDRAVCMCDSLMTFHPELVSDWFECGEGGRGER